jgi:uncharacterized protein (DUF2147 family)
MFILFGTAMKHLLATLALLTAAIAAPLSARETRAADVVASEWRNPSKSVQIRIDKCGAETLCGTITWASAKAIADAKRGGTDKLVGTQLFRDLSPAGDGKWKGKVFVPDIRKTFSGTLEFVDDNRMTGKGCVLFGMICKSQTWSRVR